MPNRVNLALISTVFLWASAFVGIRVGLSSFSPGPLALLRFIVASVFMLIIYSRLNIKEIVPLRDRIEMLCLGVLGIGLYNICLNYGEITVTAGLASFIIGLMPVITVLISAIFLKEHQSKIVWAGILLSLLGLSIINMGEPGHNNYSAGIWMIMISAMSGAIYTLVSRRYLKHYHPVAVTAWVMWGGTLMLSVFLPSLIKEIPKASHLSMIATIYMGIFPAALAYVAWSYVLNHIPASKASIFLYALPVVSTIMGFLFLHEKPTVISLMGGLIALIGAFTANRFRGQVQKVNTHKHVPYTFARETRQ